MPNNYLSVLYKHIIQVENKNVGLKVCVGGGAQTYHCPQSKKWWVLAHLPPPPPPPLLPMPVLLVYIIIKNHVFI